MLTIGVCSSLSNHVASQEIRNKPDQTENAATSDQQSRPTALGGIRIYLPLQFPPFDLQIETPKETGQQPRVGQGKDYEPPIWHGWRDWLINLANEPQAGWAAITAVLTLIYLCVVGAQTGAIRQTVNLTRTELLASHRPSIRVKHVWNKSHVLDDKPITVDLVVVNVGRSQAVIRGVKFATLVVAADRSLPPRPPLQEDVTTVDKPEIYSGQTCLIPDLVSGSVLANEDSIGIRAEDRILYCFGTVEYQDAIGIKTTAFCRRLKVSREEQGDTLGKFVVYDDPDYEYQD